MWAEYTEETELSKYPQCQYINGFNESGSYMYTPLYKITSKYYCKTYFNDPDEARTRVLLLICHTP